MKVQKLIQYVLGVVVNFSSLFKCRLTTECMIRAGLREQTCRHSTEGRTGENATTTDEALHVLYTCVTRRFFFFLYY